jgi:hypothetical protein
MVLRGILTVVLSILCSSVFAQFNGHNLLEYQYGKLPSDTVNNFSTLYDRFTADYTLKRFKAGVTLAQYYTPYNQRNYIRPTQVRLQYLSGPLEVKLGNYYETIGRGILLRSYQIQGAILEDMSYRSRHYFHRDMVGMDVKFRHKNFSAKLMSGWPLNNVFPPTRPVKDRRPERVDAFYTDFALKKQILGGALLHLDDPSGHTLYGMFTVSGNILPFLSYYTEMAKNISDYAIQDFSMKSPYAFYLNTNLIFKRFGLTGEYKIYNNFVLGSGINEPPALVKEHIYKLLNRSTHVLQPINETGFQIEAYYNMTDNGLLTFNITRAVNDVEIRYVFQEYFLEYSTTIFSEDDLKVFADFAEDPLKLEKSRITTGTNIEWLLTKKSSLNTDYEFQIFNRQERSVMNQYVLVGYNFKSRFGIDIITEFTNDPFVDENNNKFWFGGNIRYKISNNHTLLLFAGQRRGGTACNAGVCYEVLDFKGIEARLTSRF